MSVELLTNHAHVLLCVARDPQMRLRDIANCVGVTERSAQQLVCELQEAGFLEKKRVGRRNLYSVDTGVHLPNELEHGVTLGDLLSLLDAAPAAASS
jgi:predicted DNA-binding transcriptional regulator